MRLSRTTKKTFTILSIAILLGAVAVEPVSAQEDTAAYLVMIANQGTQISNQVQALTRMTNHITQLTAQFEHLKESALGQIGAITDPIADLIATPTDLLTTARGWADDFTGEGATAMIGAITDLGGGTPFSESWRDVLAEADTVSDADLRALFPERPVAAEAAVAAYQERRALADRRVILANERAGVSANLAATATNAQEKIDALAAENNVSVTALQQAVLAGSLTQGQLLAALAQLEAWTASQAAAEAYDAEVRRREFEALRLAQRTARDARWAENLVGMAASRESRLHSLFGYDVGSFYSSGRND